MYRIPIIIALLPVQLFAQRITVAEVQAMYPQLFKAEIDERDGRSYFHTDVKEVPADHPLAGLINENGHYVDHLLQNYLALDWKSFQGFTRKNEEEFRISFYRSLGTDSVFNRYFLEAVHHYLFTRGGSITDHLPEQKIRISIDSLAGIGSRFFYANRLLPNDKTEWNICVGKNGYRNTRKDGMVPLVEAFCYQAIFKNKGIEEYDLWGQMKASALRMRTERTDLDGDEKLEFYRNRMYELMGENENLKKLLRDAYAQKKEMLNFELH